MLIDELDAHLRSSVGLLVDATEIPLHNRMFLEQVIISCLLNNQYVCLLHRLNIERRRLFIQVGESFGHPPIFNGKLGGLLYTFIVDEKLSQYAIQNKIICSTNLTFNQ